MSRYALIKPQKDATHTTLQTAWNNRTAVATGDAAKLTNYTVRPDRSPMKETGLQTLSYSFVAGGVYKPTGSLEGYYRHDGGLGNIIIPAIFGSIMTTAERTANSVPDTLSFGHGTTPFSFNVADPATSVYYLGSALWPYTMRLVEDGPGVDSAIEFVNTLFQNLEITFDTRDFPKVRVDYLAGPSRNKGLSTVVPTWSNSKPAAFYNAVVQISQDGGTTWTELGCKSITLRITRKIDENYVYVGNPFLAGSATNGVTDVNGSFTTGAGATELALFDSIFHDAANTTTGEVYNDTNAMSTFALRFALFDTDFKFIGFFNAGQAVLTDGNKTIQGRDVIERTINYTCYGESEKMYFMVPTSPIVGTGGAMMADTFKGLSKEYEELIS